MGRDNITMKLMEYITKPLKKIIEGEDYYSDKVICKCGHEMYQHSPLKNHHCWICDKCKKFEEK